MTKEQKTIMVILRNVQKNNGIIECDYYPETSNDPGHIVYDYINDKIIEKVYSKSDWDGDMKPYFYYASRVLERITTRECYKQEFVSGEFRDEYRGFWY